MIGFLLAAVVVGLVVLLLVHVLTLLVKAALIGVVVLLVLGIVGATQRSSHGRGRR